MSPDESLDDFFNNIPTKGRAGTRFDRQPGATDIKTAFEALSAEQKKRLLLQPLSEDRQTNALFAGISGGGPTDIVLGDVWRSDFVKIALDEIENIEPDAKKRVALLTSANDLGQTIFHNALYSPDMFKTLTETLYKWAGTDAANKWMKSFIEQPLGTIDSELSYSLQDVRNVVPYPSEDYSYIDSLTTDRYKPATYKALTSAMEKVRPFAKEWLKKNPPEPEDLEYDDSDPDYVPMYITIKAFADDPAPVKPSATPLSDSFPYPMFDKLLDIHEKLNPQTPQQEADYIFDQLSKQDIHGDTIVHRTWEMHSRSIQLGAAIASLDKRLGEGLTLDLTKKLFMAENKKGALPLDNFILDYTPQERDEHIKSFLLSLRKELGSQEKFKTYVTEVVASFLPPDFTVKLGDYEPKPEPGKTAKPKRGAKVQP